MKTLHLPIITISCFLCLCLLVLLTQFQTASALLCPPPPKTPVTCSPNDGSCFTPDMAISPITSNKCIGLFTKFTSSENSTAKDLYLRFFNADTNQTTNNVSFFINVTKQDKILGHDLFYAHSGIFAIKFQPSVQVGDWIVEGDQDPVLGGFTSSNDTIIIYSSIFTKEGLYHIHTEVLATDHAIVNQTNTPKFDSWWSVDDKGNISQYVNSTISFESTTPSVKIKDESPLKQFKSGIASKDAKCGSNLHLIIKAEDGSFACVTIKTGIKLVLREWASTFGTGISSSDYAKCDISYKQSDTGIAVLYMPTNIIGKICVQYHNLNNAPVTIGMRIFEANDLSHNATDVTAWTYDSTLEANANKTVVYFIKTGNKTGFYGASLNCGGFPLAVGYDNNSTMTANNFPWIGQVFHCGAITYDSHIEGTTGIDVKYIPNP